MEEECDWKEEGGCCSAFNVKGFDFGRTITGHL